MPGTIVSGRVGRVALCGLLLPLILANRCDTLLKPEGRDVLDLLQGQSIQVEVEGGLLVPGEDATIYLLPRGVPGLGDLKWINKMYLEAVAPKVLKLRDGLEHAWIGRFSRGVPLPFGTEAFFMMIDGRLEARIQQGSKILRLHSAPLDARGGTQAFVEVFDAREFREHNSTLMAASATATLAFATVSSCKDPATEIDLAVFYTEQAALSANDTQVEGEPELERAPGEAAIDYHIRFAIAQANMAYEESLASPRLNLVASAQLPDDLQEGDFEELLVPHSKLATHARQHPTVRGLLESSQADRGIILYEFPDSSDLECGLQDGEQVFPAVRLSCAANHLTLVHEVGHTLGANHAPEEVGSGGASGYAYGHVERVSEDSDTVLWRTVMTTRCVCDPDGCPVDLDKLGNACTRVSYLSSPDVEGKASILGVPKKTGKAGKEDNARVHTENVALVSGSRCRDMGDVSHVWIKDTWSDQGDEPDLAAADSPMWESPDIWVRRSEDGAKNADGWWEGLEDAHVSQQAKTGAINHVYVKVHNNGRDAEIGKLQLFVAESSATPTGWVLVGETGEIKVEGRPPTGQERGFSVAKFDWLHQWPSGVPVDTGYSLIARWNPVVSDGSSPSVTDVRASKELALRTGDTIELDGSSEHAQYSSTFQVAGESGSYLLITTETNEPSVGWDVVVPSASVTIDGTEQHTIALEQTPSMVLGPYDTTTVRLNTSHGTGDAIASARDDGFAVAGADYTISFIQIRATGVIAGAEPALRAELETLFVEGKVVGGVSYSLRIPPAP